MSIDWIRGLQIQRAQKQREWFQLLEQSCRMRSRCIPTDKPLLYNPRQIDRWLLPQPHPRPHITHLHLTPILNHLFIRLNAQKTNHSNAYIYGPSFNNPLLPPSYQRHNANYLKSQPRLLFKVNAPDESTCSACSSIFRP
jgi:hypothetical protein